MADGDTSKIAPSSKTAVLRRVDAILDTAWGNSEINLTNFNDVFSIIGDVLRCIFLCFGLILFFGSGGHVKDSPRAQNGCFEAF